MNKILILLSLLLCASVAYSATTSTSLQRLSSLHKSVSTKERMLLKQPNNKSLSNSLKADSRKISRAYSALHKSSSKSHGHRKSKK